MQRMSSHTGRRAEFRTVWPLFVALALIGCGRTPTQPSSPEPSTTLPTVTTPAPAPPPTVPADPAPAPSPQPSPTPAPAPPQPPQEPRTPPEPSTTIWHAEVATQHAYDHAYSLPARFDIRLKGSELTFGPFAPVEVLTGDSQAGVSARLDGGLVTITPSTWMLNGQHVIASGTIR